MATKKELKARARKKAQRFVSFFPPSGGGKVTIDLQSNPLAGIYRSGGITYPQFAAAAEFQRDFETAGYSTMRCRGFEPGVDGGKIAGANLTAVDTQARLTRLRKHLGEEHYLLMEAVIGYGLTFEEIHRAGGEENKVISTKLREACNRAAVFYLFLKDAPNSRTVKALQKLLQDMAGAAGEFTS
jgi:hypothetical protein